MITTTAALQKGVVSLDDEFEITNGVNVGGRFINNANGEYCGGTFREAFAESCNADFAPLGPKIGNDELVATAERFGFNSPPTLYDRRATATVDPPEPSIPTEIGEELDLGVTAIGQGEVLATPLEMAASPRAIGNDGVREPTSIVANKKLRPNAEAGAGDVEEDRRRADRTDDRRRHRRHRHRRGDPRAPGGRQDRHRRAGAEARSPLAAARRAAPSSQ